MIQGLVGGYTEPRVRTGRPSIGPPEARKTERHFSEVIPDKKRKKCQVCAQTRDQGYKGTRVRTWCRPCGIGLCTGKCFEQYHT